MNIVEPSKFCAEKARWGVGGLVRVQQLNLISALYAFLVFQSLLRK